MSEMTAHEKGIHAAYEHLEGYPDIERVETIIKAYLEASGLVLVPRDRERDEPVTLADLSDGWEYKTVETGRKSGTTHEEVWPDGDGWEIDITCGRVGTPNAGWERFDYHEELYFRRRVSAKLEEGNIND